MTQKKNMNPSCLYPFTMDGRASKNHVYLKNVITNPNITVGDYTFYHDLENPHFFEERNAAYVPAFLDEKLIIGKYCSIAHGAQFISNVANHAIDGFSTYPFAPIFGKDAGYDYTYPKKGDIIIGHDVWIGTEAMILPGVHVGDGAVIGAKAVVTKDVSPYTIVAGNPARQIKQRFSRDIIDALLALKWWNWPHEVVVKNAASLVGKDIEALKRISVSLKGE